MSVTKLVVYLRDLNSDALDRIKEVMGKDWNEALLDREVFTLKAVERKVEEGRSAIRHLAEKVWETLEEDEKDGFRRKLDKHGHNCYDCDKTECTIHPDFRGDDGMMGMSEVQEMSEADEMDFLANLFDGIENGPKQ